jgi:hypothetical protein
MCSPSGENSGFVSACGPLVSRSTPEPSAFITKMCGTPLLRSLENTTFVPLALVVGRIGGEPTNSRPVVSHGEDVRMASGAAGERDP